MSEQIETKVRFIKNRTVILAGIFIIICNAANWFFLAYKIKPQADPIYLHYTIYFGVDLIGQWFRLFIMPAVGTLVWLVNFVFAFFIYRKGVFISYLILWITFFLQFSLLFASYLIIRANV